MVKICETGLLKLNFETRPKKRHFPVFAKNFRRPWMKLKKFFCQIPNPWALRVSGMGGYTSKCEKMSKSLHPTAYSSGLRPIQFIRSTHTHTYAHHAPHSIRSSHFYVVDYYIYSQYISQLEYS
jgi:hypothetical protein